MAKLIVSGGPDRDKEFPLGQNQTIGRLKANEVPINDNGLSRKHARLYRHGGRWVVVDLNSKNGVTLNGEKVHKAEIVDGDTFLVGNTYLQMVFEPHDSSDLALERQREREAQPQVSSASSVSYGRGDSVSASPSRLVTSQKKVRAMSHTRTSLAWMRSDLGQVGGLYKTLVVIGALALLGGVVYLVVALIAG